MRVYIQVDAKKADINREGKKTRQKQAQVRLQIQSNIINSN